MKWIERIRLFIDNYKEQIDARPLALPPQHRLQRRRTPGFWKVLEDLLAILLDAGFGRREAIVLIRMISNLLAGYLLLLQQGAAAGASALLAQRPPARPVATALRARAAEPAPRRVPEPGRKRGRHGRGLAD